MTVDSTSSHDEMLSFDELSQRYNFEQTPVDSVVFRKFLVDLCQQNSTPPRVIDIGCGAGLTRQSNQGQWSIKELAGEYWGLEPDSSVVPQPGLFDHFQHSFMENADLPEAYFDVAYSYAVMEHVANPLAFLQAVRRCLRPGGSYLFMTPNARHYFGIIAKSCERMGLDRLVLRLVTNKTDLSRNYPLEYRINTRRAIAEAAEASGFLPPKIVYLEAVGPRGYMRGPLRPLFHLLAWKRRIIKNPEILSTIICRLTRPMEDS